MESEDRERITLAALVFTVLLSQVLLYPGVADLVDALGATTSLDASMWFLGSEFLGYVLFVGVWGLASDRFGQRRRLIALGALGGAIGYALVPTLASISAVTFEALVVIRFVQGALTIGAFSLAMTMLMDLPGGEGRNLAMAGLAIGLGTGIGAPLGGVMTDIHPFTPMLVASGLLLVVGSATLLVRDRVPDRARSLLGGFDVVRHRPLVLLPYCFGLIDRFTAGFFALVGTLYFQDAFGLTASETGMMLALFFLPFALFQYPFGVLADRIGRVPPMVAGSVLYGVGIIAVGLAPSVVLAGTAMVAVGVLGALVLPATMAFVSDLAGATERATAMSGFNFFGSLGFLAGFFLGGTVADVFGFTAAFLVAGGLEIGIAVVAVPLLVHVGLLEGFWPS